MHIFFKLSFEEVNGVFTIFINGTVPGEVFSNSGEFLARWKQLNEQLSAQLLFNDDSPPPNPNAPSVGC